MEPQEVVENTEKAKQSGERAIGLTMAVLAVLLAAATLLSHRAHTEEVMLETRATDQWNYFQAKNIRYHVYDADAQIASLFAEKGAQAAADFRLKSEQQKKDSEEIQAEAEKLGREVQVTSRKAGFYDAGELFLEVAIVLSSISLLAKSRLYWRSSFLFSVAGVAVGLWGLLVIR
ncbi:MAG TPA: DUF4337 domain-containing protein [Candidatus Acidoferrales bacterium]|jgi:hypothetical protein|nr:DUF4337 domain-containing protein [Candidatus Acidoferrales bacterium]